MKQALRVVTFILGMMIGILMLFVPESIGLEEKWRAGGAALMLMSVGLVFLSTKENG